MSLMKIFGQLNEHRQAEQGGRDELSPLLLTHPKHPSLSKSDRLQTPH